MEGKVNSMTIITKIRINHDYDHDWSWLIMIGFTIKMTIVGDENWSCSWWCQTWKQWKWWNFVKINIFRWDYEGLQCFNFFLIFNVFNVFRCKTMKVSRRKKQLKLYKKGIQSSVIWIKLHSPLHLGKIFLGKFSTIGSKTFKMHFLFF